jgi:hypothetical protein
MTPDEFATLGKTCLAEYESKLNILGPAQPYNNGAVMATTSFNVPLEAVDERRARFEIARLLDPLALITGLRMSEPKPDPTLRKLYRVDTVRHGDLNFMFVSMYDSSTLETITHLRCWYFPEE